jgi:hypothetical protein
VSNDVIALAMLQNAIEASDQGDHRARGLRLSLGSSASGNIVTYTACDVCGNAGEVEPVTIGAETRNLCQNCLSDESP